MHLLHGSKGSKEKAGALFFSFFFFFFYTSAALEHVVDLSKQHGHVAQLRLPGLAEHLQVLFGYLAGGVESQGLGR